MFDFRVFCVLEEAFAFGGVSDVARGSSLGFRDLVLLYAFVQDFVIATMDVKNDSIVAEQASPIEQKTKLQSPSSDYSAVASTGCSYFVFMMCVGVVLRHFSDRDFSTVLTLGAGVQCLAFYLLLQKVKRQRSVAGISSKMLEMYVCVLLLRLSSTLIKQGCAAAGFFVCRIGRSTVCQV